MAEANRENGFAPEASQSIPFAGGLGFPSIAKGQSPSPAQISLVYESRDKRFCLFEDSSGHLTAVRSSRLV